MNFEMKPAEFSIFTKSLGAGRRQNRAPVRMRLGRYSRGQNEDRSGIPVGADWSLELNYIELFQCLSCHMIRPRFDADPQLSSYVQKTPVFERSKLFVARSLANVEDINRTGLDTFSPLRIVVQ